MRCWSCRKDLAKSVVNEMMRMLRPGAMSNMESPFITRKRICGAVLLSLWSDLFFDRGGTLSKVCLEAYFLVPPSKSTDDVSAGLSHYYLF
jgi:hypothetical protein